VGAKWGCFGGGPFLKSSGAETQRRIPKHCVCGQGLALCARLWRSAKDSGKFLVALPRMAGVHERISATVSSCDVMVLAYSTPRGRSGLGAA
jgi:hypothetical protein